MPAGVYEEKDILKGIVHRLVGDRLGEEGDVLNGFVWRYLFSRELVVDEKIRFEGAYLEDELFLIEYFCHAKRLAMSAAPLYYYVQNPTSVTRTYLPDYLLTFTRFMKRKEDLVEQIGRAHV